MDDESYFSLDGSNFYENYYFSHESMDVADNVKFKFVGKFTAKVLVWIAISEKGMSKVFISKSKNAVNAEIYLNECIKKRLVKFINKYHKEDIYVFWPDLASSHYAHTTLEEFKRLNIKVVPKDSNPPNVPQLRPIEKFWAILKIDVYKDVWTAKTIPELIKRITLKLKSLRPNLSQNLMKGLKTKVRNAEDNGVLLVKI